MAQLNREFDSTVVPAGDPFELIPDGTVVTVVLDQSDMCQTKRGDGQRLKCEYVVIEGPYEGRRLYENLNLDNPSEKAVKIAERQLASLCAAAGKLKVSDSDELHGIPVLAKIGVEAESNGYPARNKIKSFFSASVDAKPADAKPVAAKQAAPWARK